MNRLKGWCDKKKKKKERIKNNENNRRVHKFPDHFFFLMIYPLGLDFGTGEGHATCISCHDGSLMSLNRSVKRFLHQPVLQFRALLENRIVKRFVGVLTRLPIVHHGGRIRTGTLSLW